MRIKRVNDIEPSVEIALSDKIYLKILSHEEKKNIL